MNHPPAMGGKTAWGVTELLNSSAVQDPQELAKIKSAQADFEAREEQRLQRLHDMKSRGSDIVLDRRNRSLGFDMKVGTNDYEYRCKQDDILKKMKDAKDAKREAAKEERARLGITKKKKPKKKQKQEESSSDSSSDSSSSSSSDSKSGKKKAKTSMEKKLGVGGVIMFADIKEAEAETVVEEAPVDPEQARRDAEARAREREVKRKAKEQAALWAEEVKRKEAEVERKRVAEAKRKAEELEATRKAEAEAKRTAEEEATKKKAAEEGAKRAEGGGDKRKLFAADSGTRRVAAKVSAGEKSKPVIGGFFEGQTVYAAKNITVKGHVVIKTNCQGTISGPAENNPTQRIAVEFAKREDRLVGRMNVVPAEIKKRR